jgi:hypothetical protein
VDFGRSAVVALALGLFATSTSVTLTGCEPTQRLASPADLTRLGMRQYPRHQPSDVRRAIVTSLKVQGYEVVTETPRVRTAPKLLAIHGVRGGGVAQAVQETIAWDIDVQPAGDGTIVQARLQGAVSGEPLKGFYYEHAERNCKALFRDLDDSLGTVEPTPGPTPPSTKL